MRAQQDQQDQASSAAPEAVFSPETRSRELSRIQQAVEQVPFTVELLGAMLCGIGLRGQAGGDARAVGASARTSCGEQRGTVRVAVAGALMLLVQDASRQLELHQNLQTFKSHNEALQRALKDSQVQVVPACLLLHMTLYNMSARRTAAAGSCAGASK